MSSRNRRDKKCSLRTEVNLKAPVKELILIQKAFHPGRSEASWKSQMLMMLQHVAKEVMGQRAKRGYPNSAFRKGSKNINKSVMAAVCGEPYQATGWYKGHKTQDLLSRCLLLISQEPQKRRSHLRRNQSIKGE